jgi:diguanylate cyclase (GGDEF)-like protein
VNGIIDREQEQARLRADTLGSQARAGRDLGWIVAGSVVVALVVIATHALRGAWSWAEDLHGRDMTGILILGLIVPIGAGTFAWLRYRDAGTARASLFRLSYHDGLTGLPNRRFLGDGFDQMLKQTRRQNGRIAVIFVDLDGFEEINSTYGPAVGDQVMIAVAARLVEAIGREDRAVRYGGDQFVLFCPDVSTAISAERIARRVLQFIERPLEVGDDRARLSASMGLAITEERCTRPDEVLQDADTALHQARQLGSGRLVMFDRAMRDQVSPSTARRRMRQALDNGEFRLYYRPIVSLWTKRLVGVEALLRWAEPTRGLLGPEEFMPALEDTGLIVPIGSWVIEEVARQSRAWRDGFPDRPALSIKVNVSRRQMAQANFMTRLGEVLDESGVQPERLYLGISEGVLESDAEATWTILREAKARGLALALDDFGTGYSSFSYLREVQLDMLTVHRSFVEGIDQSEEDLLIVEHMIAMAKALGIATVADGVETAEQVEVLRGLNCDLACGAYFSEPQPPYVITDLLSRTAGTGEWSPSFRSAVDGDHGDSDEIDDDGPGSEGGAPPVVILDRRLNIADR